MKPEKIIKLIRKKLKEHKAERDPDGFPCCPIKQQLETRVASEEEWLGTKESRQQAIQDQEDMDKHIYCDYCSLCTELIKVIENE